MSDPHPHTGRRQFLAASAWAGAVGLFMPATAPPSQGAEALAPAATAPAATIPAGASVAGAAIAEPRGGATKEGDFRPAPDQKLTKTDAKPRVPSSMIA